MKSKTLETVTVIGMGYVGFPLACAIAKSEKYEVYGLDLDGVKIRKINRRVSPIKDKQAEEDLKSVKIIGTLDSSVLTKSKFIIICVPTPVNGNKEPDLTPVIKAVEEIARHLQKGQVIILESTVNPGVCEEVIIPLLEKSRLKCGIDFELAHCPERIDPGNHTWNVYNIPRNIGGATKEGTHLAAEFYRSFLNAPVNEMSGLKVAESTKIVENVFRDVNIALVNELAESFDKLKIDLTEVISGASTKPFAFIPHYPGCGVGGHCIAVDPYYLINYAEKHGFDHRLLKLARKINSNMPNYTVEKLEKGLQELGLKIKGAKIGLLGLSYKANVGDLRESPAIDIKKILEEKGAEVYVSEPYCSNDSAECRKHVISTTEEVLEKSQAVILADCHDEFKHIKDWKRVKLVVSCHNCLEREDLKKKGVLYKGIGGGD